MTTYSHVRDAVRYFNRTVQEWHTLCFDEQCSAMDVDLGGFCKQCGNWLYLLEAAELWGKPVSQVHRLSLQTGAVGLLVVHAETRVLGGQRVTPDRSARFDEPTLQQYIRQIRAAHLNVWHRNTWATS